MTVLQKIQHNSKLLLLVVPFMLAGAIAMYLGATGRADLEEVDLTSVGLIGGALLFYIGIAVIVGLLGSERALSITIILPSIVAVFIFVYAFIAWSVRV